MHSQHPVPARSAHTPPRVRCESQTGCPPSPARPLTRLAAQLLAQIVDIDLHDVRSCSSRHAPHLAQQLGPAAHSLSAPPQQTIPAARTRSPSAPPRAPPGSICAPRGPSPDRQSAASGPRTGCGAGTTPSTARAVHGTRTASAPRRRHPAPGTSLSLPSPHARSAPAPRSSENAAAISASTSIPSLRGSPRSSTTSSGRSFSAEASAASPSATSATSWPSSFKPRLRNCPNETSSSTINTCIRCLIVLRISYRLAQPVHLPMPAELRPASANGCISPQSILSPLSSGAVPDTTVR